MNPPKRDAWGQPRAWRHVWVRLDHTNLPPLPGLILDWRRVGARWSAWVVWINASRARPEVGLGWVGEEHLRPAKSDINIWNDGPYR